MMRVTRWHLVMDAPDQLRPAVRAGPGLEVRRVEGPRPEWSRFLYVAVGRDWQWTDRLTWKPEEWARFAARPEVETWVAWDEGAPAGYYELEHRTDGTVELLYFGLLPAFLGRGFGGPLLTHAVRRAFALGAHRIRLNTCSLDHPAALAAYQARGFRIEGEEVYDRPDPVLDGPR